MIVSIHEMQCRVHANAVNKAFWEEHGEPVAGRYELTPAEILSKLMLTVTEVAEAAEDVREGKMETTLDERGKPVGLGSELADIVIRVMDLAGGLGIDLESEMLRKASYNEGRERLHGKLL